MQMILRLLSNLHSFRLVLQILFLQFLEKMDFISFANSLFGFIIDAFSWACATVVECVSHKKNIFEQAFDASN